MLFFKVLFILINSSHADVIPTQIADGQSDVVIDAFSSSYSAALAKHSYALGKEAALSLSSSYIDLSDISELGNQTNNKFIFINHLSVSKGLYQNFDLGFSSVVPVESNESISGYGGYISWLKKLKGYSFKPTVYLHNLNIDNVFNAFGAGLSLSFFTQVSFFKIGAHYIAESNETNIQSAKAGSNIFTSGESKKKQSIYNAAAVSIALEAKNFDFIIQPIYTFGGSDFSVSMKLNFNI